MSLFIQQRTSPSTLMFCSHQWQGSKLHHHGPNSRAQIHCLETKGVQPPALYIPQPPASSILDGVRNISDLNPVFLGQAGQCSLLPGTHCAAVSTKMGSGLDISAVQPCQQMGLAPSQKRSGHEEDGHIVTSDLNLARNQKPIEPIEQICLTAETLLWHLAKRVLVANSTDSTTHLTL